MFKLFNQLAFFVVEDVTKRICDFINTIAELRQYVQKMWT